MQHTSFKRFCYFLFLVFGNVGYTQTLFPSNFPSLKLWLLPDSTITNSSLISDWLDNSGLSNNISQNISDRQPIVINNAINGYSAVRFDGLNDFLKGSFNSSIQQPNTVAVLFKTSNTSNNYIFDGGTSFHGVRYFSGNLYMRIASSLVGFPIQSPLEYSVYVFEFNQGQSKIYKNSVLVAQGSFPNSTLDGFTLGSIFSGNTLYMNGDIVEVIIFDEVLNINDRLGIESYFFNKFAPPVHLGSDILQYGFCDTTIYAGERFTSYLWSDGSTADSLVASGPGKYWVEVTDIFGFISRDTIEVLSGLNYPTTQLYCQNDSIIWNTNLGQHYSYLWSDNSTADTLEIDTPGDYYVTVTDTNGCFFESDTLTFAEDPFSTLATLGPDLSLCSGNNIALTAGANSATSYLWNTTATIPEITITTTGAYSVIVQNANGCEVKDTIDVTILGDAPVINAQLPSITCVAEDFNFQDLSTTTDGSTIIGWDWDLGDGTTSLLNQGNHAYSAGGIYDVDLTVETSVGCFNDQTFTIEVKENPILTYATSNQCQDESIQFNGGQMSPQTIASWEWNFDDPASGIDNTANGQNPFHTFAIAGDYDVMLIGTDVFGCVDTLIQTKTIEPTPVADFSFTEVCEGNTVTFQNNSTVSSPSVISANQWSFGDGTNSNQSNPQKPYSLYGTYTVDLTTSANNGCSHSISKNIKIHATPQVQFSINQACAGIETSFEDNSFVPDGSVAQVNWKFGNETPLSGFDITKNFTNSGNYTLEQTVSSGFGCINSAVSTLTINPYLNADFIFTPNAFIAEYPIAFESTSSGENAYLWSFGNIANSTLADTSIIFEENLIGTEQTVELRVENQWNCSDSISVKLPVLEQRTDLEISQIFSQDINGFLTIGVRLKNIGSTPISEVDLVLNSPSTGLIKETWVGMLQANEEEIYIFSASPSAQTTVEDSLQNFMCIAGTIVLPAQFIEEDISNNEVCKTMSENQTVIVFPYPNPVKEQLTVKVVMPKKGVIALNIYDSFGKIIHTITEKQELEKGLTIFIVETGAWSNGRYTIVYEGEGNVPSVGFVKL